MSSSVIAAGAAGSRVWPYSSPPPRSHRPLAAATAAAEQDDLVGLDLGGVVLLAVLLPAAGLEPAFEVDLLALGEVRLQRLGLLAPQHDAVPLRLFLLLAVLRRPVLGGGDAEARHRAAAGREADFARRAPGCRPESPCSRCPSSSSSPVARAHGARAALRVPRSPRGVVDAVLVVPTDARAALYCWRRLSASSRCLASRPASESVKFFTAKSYDSRARSGWFMRSSTRPRL